MQMASQYTVSNQSIGLNSEKIDEMNLTNALFKFLHTKKQAPTPTQTVGGCNTLRKRILQVSLFPDIYDKRANKRSPGNVDFGDPHAIKDMARG
jgi:hypothetical protein